MFIFKPDFFGGYAFFLYFCTVRIGGVINRSTRATNTPFLAFKLYWVI